LCISFTTPLAFDDVELSVARRAVTLPVTEPLPDTETFH